jgi:hypothetical protein
LCDFTVHTSTVSGGTRRNNAPRLTHVCASLDRLATSLRPARQHELIAKTGHTGDLS